MSQSLEARYPPAEFVRGGPPHDVRELHRQKTEKWARVVLVFPRPEDTPDRTRYDFVSKGPFTLPMAVVREGVDRGSRDAWQFFTHPYAVFPEDAAYFNVPGEGCLGARLFVRTPQGVQLYDEVGAGLPGSEFVADSYQGALGVLRRRVLEDPRRSAEVSFAPDLLETDIDLLEVFHLSTLLLRTHTPGDVLNRLYRLFRKPTVHDFAWSIFDEEEQDLMRGLREGRVNPEDAVARFRVNEEDFTKITDVRDASGRQAILELLSEWQAFEAQHAERLHELGLGIQREEQQLEEIKARVRELQQQGKTKKDTRSGLSRLFGRNPKSELTELKGEAVRALRAKREHEAAFDQIPGYGQVRGLTDRVQGFQASIAEIHRLARDLSEHNVDRELLESLRALVRDKVLSESPEEALQGHRAYGLRLRAEVLPRLLTTYSTSAYVLRRPDALRATTPSFRSVRRINTLARHLIEYFRYVRYGQKTLGEAFDEGWGQVLQLEARL